MYLFGYPIEQWMPVLYFFIYLAAIICVAESIEHNIIGWISSAFLLISFLFYNYFNSEDKQHKDYEIEELKREVQRLQESKQYYQWRIEKLEEELENVRNNSQQD